MAMLQRCLTSSLLTSLIHASSTHARLLSSDRVKFEKVNGEKASLEKITGALDVIKSAKLQIIEALALIDNETRLLEGKVESLTGVPEAAPGPSVMEKLVEAEALVAAGAVAGAAIAAEALKSEPVIEAAAAEKIVVEEVVLEAVAAEEIAAEPVWEAVASEEIAAEPVLEAVASEEIAAEPVLEAVASEEITAEPVLEAAASEEIAAEPVLEAVAAEEIIAEPVLEAVVAEEIVAEPVLEAVAAEEIVAEPVVAESETVVEASSTIIEDVAEKVAVHVVKEAVISSAGSVAEAVKEAVAEPIETAPVEPAAEVEPAVVIPAVEAVTEVVEDDTVEFQLASLAPEVLTPEELAAVSAACALYAPLGSKLPLSFSDYCTIKKGLRWRCRLAGSVGFFGGPSLTIWDTMSRYPEYFGVEPALIMGYDSMLVVGVGSFGVGMAAMVLGNMLAKQMTIGWFRGKYRAAYSERDKDFKRRVNHHRFKEDTKGKMTDPWDLLNNGWGYRQWIRKEQESIKKHKAGIVI